MTAHVLIRAAVAADLDGVAALSGSRHRALARLRAAEIGDDSMLVAALAGRILGAASVRWSGDCDPPYPWMYGLYVSAEVRRSGVGRSLVRAAEELCERRGASHLSLDVDAGDARAVAFYRALGYAVVGPHQHHWRSVHPGTGAVIAEGVVPALRLRRPL